MPKYNNQPVRDGRTLRALERAGHIEEPSKGLRPKGARWGSGYAYVDQADEKPPEFTHKGRRYKVSYIDGCFFPFVFVEVES